MIEYVYPALFALFIWWFSTGVIIYLDNLPRWTFKWSMLGATGVLALSVWGLAETSSDTSLLGAYLSFTCGVLAWGWHEIGFYTGTITGRRKETCADHCSGLQHLVHAIDATLWHEISVFVGAGALLWLVAETDNWTGFWAYLILLVMQHSAKLNVMLGVRNLSANLLPEHLGFLKGFMRQRPMNLLFPISITGSTIVLTLMVQAAVAVDATVAEKVAVTALATLLALAILEHWLLMLPIDVERLWEWALSARKARAGWTYPKSSRGRPGDGKFSVQPVLAEGSANRQVGGRHVV